MSSVNYSLKHKGVKLIPSEKAWVKGKNGKPKSKPKYPHFRYYKPSKHPALITAEHSKDEYKYRKVMHSEKDGRHFNEKLYPNPNPKDSKPMYIGKRVRHDKKTKFEKQILPWKYPIK